MQLQLICEDPSQQSHLDELAARWQLSHTDDSDFALVLTTERLELRKVDEPKLGAIFVDLIGGAVGHRRKFGGGKGQAIAKAAGLSGQIQAGPRFSLKSGRRAACRLGYWRDLESTLIRRRCSGAAFLPHKTAESGREGFQFAHAHLQIER